MISDAPKFCLSSLTTTGESTTAKIYRTTEFEQAVLDQGNAADPAMEMGYVLKVIQRFCDQREDPFDTVLKMHSELPTPKGRD